MGLGGNLKPVPDLGFGGGLWGVALLSSGLSLLNSCELNREIRSLALPFFGAGLAGSLGVVGSSTWSEAIMIDTPPV